MSYEGSLRRETIKKMNEYEKYFDDIFPLMQFDGTEEDIEKEIDKCLKNKKKYDAKWWKKHPDCIE